MSDVGMTRRLRLGPVLAVLSAVLLAGCTGVVVFTDDREPELPDPETIAETHESLEAYSFEGRITSSGLENESSFRAVMTTIVRPGAGEVYEEIINESGTRSISVSNGTTRWVYTEGQQTVTREPAPDSQRRLAIVDDLVQAVKSTGGTDPPRLFPAFPGATSGQGSDTGAATTLGDSTVAAVSYEGTETVAGRETHVIAAEHSDQSDVSLVDDSQFEQSIYLDTEWYVPLKIEAVTRTGERTYRTEYVAESVNFDPEIEPGLFEFEPPESATVVDPTERFETIENRRALEATVADLPDPQLPDGVSFKQAMVDRETGGITLSYTGDQRQLVVSRTPADGPEQPDGESVELDEQTGYYSEDPVPTVAWTCGGDRYDVVGEFDRDQLVQIAASLACS